MDPSSGKDVAQLSIDAWIDQVADRFDAAWQAADEPPRIAEFLGESSGESRSRLVRELVAIDREYRDKHGLSRSWGDYVAEFPELATDPATDSALIDSTKEMVKPTAAAAPAFAADEQPQADPAQIGKYRVLQKLGGGGQATAFLAFDPDLSKSVVLKLSHDAADEPELDALKSEGRVLADLDHPHLVRVLHYDLFDGRPYLVMEHIAGQNLAQWVAAARPLPLAGAKVAADIARALAAAHKRGVVHRDLKPANVLIDETGQPRVIDFGLAWHRHGWSESGETDSMIAGTVAYMAPEQARGETERVGPRSDIFGIGAILYYLLTGQAPFMEKGERDFQAVLNRARRCSFDAGLLARRSTPPKLAAICMKAMSAEPDQRYASADELADDLENFAEGGRASRRRWLAAGAIIAAAAAGGAYAIFRQPALPPITTPAMAVRLWRDGKELPDFVSAAPLQSGRDEMQVRWQLPPSLAGDLYVVDPDNALTLLAAGLPPETGEGIWPAASQRSPVAGSAGTEMLLLGIRRASRPQPQVAWDASAAWPGLPETLVLRLTPTGIEVVQKSRAVPFGPAREFDDPEEVINQRLKTLAVALKTQFEHFEAVVFSVQTP